MIAISAFLLGLLFTLGGYRALRFAVRLASAALFGVAAGCLGLDDVPVLVAGLLGFLLGNAVYWLSILAVGAAGGVLLGFLAAGQVSLAAGVAGAVVGAVAALHFERPLALASLAVLAARLLA